MSMGSRIRNFLAFLLGAVDALAARWLRSRHLGYRRQLHAAAGRGDVEFIRGEVARNQLDASDLARLRRRHTGVDEWPDEPEGLVAPVPTDEAHATRQ